MCRLFLLAVLFSGAAGVGKGSQIRDCAVVRFCSFDEEIQECLPADLDDTVTLYVSDYEELVEVFVASDRVLRFRLVEPEEIHVSAGNDDFSSPVALVTDNRFKDVLMVELGAWPAPVTHQLACEELQ